MGPLSLLQVLTLWQGCVAICHAFPKSPDVLAIVNAVAREAGEPSTHALSSAVGQTVDEGTARPYICTLNLITAKCAAALASMTWLPAGRRRICPYCI